MKRNQSIGFISGEVIGNNRSLYKSVESVKAELNREIEKELRGHRHTKATADDSAKQSTTKSLYLRG